MPTALITLILIATLAAGLLRVTAGSANQNQRLDAAKRALAAADAGIDEQLFRLNAVQPPITQCADEQAGRLIAADPAPDGWCHGDRVIAGDDSVETRVTPASLRQDPCQIKQLRTIVSVGTAYWKGAPVKRRLTATIESNTGAIFSTCSIVSLKQIKTFNTTYLHGNVATNGQAVIDDKSSACGNVSADTLSLSPNATRLCGIDTDNPSGPIYTLRRISAICKADTPWRDPVCNNNAFIPAGDGTGGIGGVTGKPDRLFPRDSSGVGPEWEDADWNEPGIPERDLTLNRRSQLTLTGNVYSFCHIAINDRAQLIIAPRDRSKPVKIFIDEPENCPGQPGWRTAFLELHDRGTIVNTNPDPTSLQIYMRGTNDPGRLYGTKAYFATDPSRYQDSTAEADDLFMNFVLYAPRSRVVVRHETRILGAIAAKEVTLRDKAKIAWSSEVERLDGSNFSVTRDHVVSGWLECPPPSPADLTLLQGCVNP